MQNFTRPFLNEGEREIIRQAGKRLHYSRGSNLFVAGDPADRIYLLEEGWVKIYRMSGDGKQVTVGSLRRPGELMGLAEAVAGGLRTCCAGAVSDLVVFAVARETFMQLLDTEPFLAVKIAKLLATRMREAESGIAGMASYQVRERLVRLLLEMAETCGTADENGISLNLNLTHEELAAMVGSSRQTISSLMGELNRERSVISGRGEIIILDPDSLARRLH